MEIWNSRKFRKYFITPCLTTQVGSVIFFRYTRPHEELPEFEFAFLVGQRGLASGLAGTRFADDIPIYRHGIRAILRECCCQPACASPRQATVLDHQPISGIWHVVALGDSGNLPACVRLPHTCGSGKFMAVCYGFSGVILVGGSSARNLYATRDQVLQPRICPLGDLDWPCDQQFNWNSGMAAACRADGVVH